MIILKKRVRVIKTLKKRKNKKKKGNKILFEYMILNYGKDLFLFIFYLFKYIT